MARQLRIPFVVDMVRTGEPDEIEAFLRDPRLDRRFADRSALVHRLLIGRVRRVLQLDGEPLPPVAPRRSAGRGEAQRRLAARLDALAEPADAETIDALAAYVRGERPAADAGPLAQQAIGRLFDPAYRADAESWRAARALDRAARRLLSPAGCLSVLTGAIRKVRALLARKVGGDPTGLHATGIAVHNLARSLERMRALAARHGARDTLEGEEAASICLAAPATILRQAEMQGATAAAEFRPGTLVVLELDAAQARTLGTRFALLPDAWSFCPARRWVPELLAAVWTRAR